MTQFALGSVSLHVLEGDITAQDVDAIVNAANNQFWMGSGVAGAIKRRGGEAIEQEAMALGPVQPGEVVVTGAGRLQARYVIHAAVMGQDLRTDATLIRRATDKALAIAAERRWRSIALPALGTGVGGFSLDECARLMTEAVRAHVAGRTSLERVVFVLFGESAHHAFEAAVRRTLEGQHA